MMNWTTFAISIASLVGGGGLTILGQFLSDKRIYKREREGRREGFYLKRFETERDTLIELRDSLYEFAALNRKLRGRILQGEVSSDLVELNEKRYELNSKVYVLALGAASEGVEDAVIEGFLASERSMNDSVRETRSVDSELHAVARTKYNEAQRLIGHALKRDPFAAVHIPPYASKALR